ncbi:MAG: flagellar hook-associated protein FlgK [Sulfurimonas sp.]
MASIFNALNIGYTGLNAAQVGIDTTGHNIANAEVEGYSRQRVVTSAATPLSARAGQVGNGTQIQDIKRIFDNFVFDRYSSISADKEKSDYEQKTLETLSTFFPEIDGVGIKADLTNYYNSWQTFSDNPSNDAIKVDLAQQTQTLTQHIKQTQSQVLDLQSQANDELGVNINQVNDLAEQIADLNIAIDVAEAAGGYSANDLRDKRNVMERTLSRLIGSNVNPGNITADTQIDSNSNVKNGSYTLSVNGFNIVDGNSFHPLKLTNDTNKFGFYEVSYERQDGVLISLNEKIDGGKIGAIFDLRGRDVDTTDGMPTDGTLQNVVSQLDAFAKGIIESTNNLYAANATNKMISNDTKVDLSNNSLISSDLNIKKGAFDLIVYDLDGNEVARRSVNIDEATVMSGASGSNSIQGQISQIKDDNSDGNANNDIDDYIKFSYSSSSTGEHKLGLSMETLADSKGYRFSIEDKLTDDNYASGSNFAGALGLGRYFDGENARDMQLNVDLQNNPTKISAGYSGSSGDNRTALNMVQQQFEDYDFQVGSQIFNTTTYGMFDLTATFVGTNTNAAILKNETISTQFNATELEYFSTTKVSIDEEMTNLIRYQTAYGAAAKIITTIDQMMQTLLGIKQ